MNTKLALLIDECVPRHMAEAIAQCSGVSSAEHITNAHHLGNCGTPDERVIEYANQTKRIVVTVETRMNEDSFAICTNPGIIVIHSTSGHGFSKSELFAKFMRSGDRKHARHAVTHLRVNGSTIKRRNEDDGIMSEMKIVI